MPVAITGMHRSGTSMVAHALSVCGLDLGPTDQLLPADAWNADGYWENRKFVELDDWLLDQLGGSWDMPPAGHADDDLRKSFLDAVGRAVAEIGFSGAWGWKDPRICLVADVWREVFADLKFVVVVRNPIEVSLSLLRRGATSARLGLSLWSTYYSELLARVPAADRVVVAYDAFLADPSASVERLIDRLGLTIDSAQMEAAVASVKPGLRHHASDYGLAGLPAHVVELYEALLVESRDIASADPSQREPSAETTRPYSGGFSVEVLIAAYSERDALRSEVDGLTVDRDNWREIAGVHESERARVAKALEEVQHQAGAVEADRDRWRGAAEIAESGRLEAATAAESQLEAARTAESERDQLLLQLEAAEKRLAAERAELDELSQDRDEWAGELIRDRDRWMAQAEGLIGAQALLNGELVNMTQDRDTWRDEAGRLVADRDAWRTEARHWQSETERLISAEHRRLGGRLRRASFYSARRIWRALPATVRKRLRPIIFESTHIGPEPLQKDEPPPPSGSPPARNPRPRPAATSRRAIDVPISVVVPTFNAGNDAALFLAALDRQVGIGERELVIADSGSADGTREVFAAAADVMLDIPAGEFGHGRTRNQAFAASSGEVVVMTVQDALLLGPHALRDLVDQLLSDDELAAVSARQLPRSDADYFGAFNVVSHYNALWREGRYAKPGDPLYLRAAAGVDDVCVAIRRATWEQGIQYRDVEFAEDLDLGMQAVGAGWRIGLSDSVAVAHSHTRSAPYHFRRAIADRVNIAPLVGENGVCRSASAAGIGEIVAAGRAILGDVAATLALAPDSQDRLSMQLQRVADRVLSPMTTREPSGGELGLLAEFFAEFADGSESGAASAPLRAEFATFLGWPFLLEFADAQRAPSSEAVADFAAKLLAAVVGRSVGDRLRVEDLPGERERLLVGV